MSIGYSAIAVALGASQAHNLDGTLGGRVAAPIDKVFGVFNRCVLLIVGSGVVCQWPPMISQWLFRGFALGCLPVCTLLLLRSTYHNLTPNAPRNATAFDSLGNIGFAYSSAIVLLEVQDTLREPPKAEVSMKKSLNMG